MNLKSRSIFKNFSAVFLSLLIITVIFIPLEPARAGSGLGDLISFNIFDIISEFIASAALDEGGFFESIYFLAYQLLNLGLIVVTTLVYFGAWLIDVFLDEAIYTSVLDMTNKTSAVYIGWTTIRDACNTFFILFLLLIAFSTILRIQAYSAKSLLPKLIISLFLINFSATIAMMVIDFGQVFMFEIKTWMGAGGFSNTAGSPLTSIVDYFNNEYNFRSPSKSYLLSDVVGVAFALCYSAILGLLYIMLALFLLVRIIMFVILVIFSPFAFFSTILPGMRTYTSQWWSSLMSNAIFGPVFLFFIFLSGKMAQSMQTFDPIEPGDEISSLAYIIKELIPHVVALGMLFAAIPATKEIGAAGASKIIGGAAGLGVIGAGVIGATKLAGGTGKKGAGWGGRRAGVDSRKVGNVLRGGTKWVADKIPTKAGKKISERVGSEIILKETKIKTKDREAISKQYTELNLKDMKGEHALSVAKAESSKAIIGESGEKSKTKIAALIQRAIEDGVNMAEKDGSGKFKNDRLISIAKAHNINTDEIAKHDPRAAEALGGKKAKEYYNEHAESGDWKKYKGHVWEEDYPDIQEAVNNNGNLRNYRKSSGKIMQSHMDKGAENNVANKHSAWKKAMDDGDAIAISQAKKNYDKAQESAAVVTGDVRTVYGKRDYDKGTGESKLKKDSTGKIEVDDRALSGSIDKLSENFKNFNTDSKKLFGQHAKGVSALDLKGQGQVDIDALIDGLKSNTSAVRREAVNMTILGQRLKTRNLYEEFGGKNQKDNKAKDRSSKSGSDKGKQSTIDQF